MIEFEYYVKKRLFKHFQDKFLSTSIFIYFEKFLTEIDNDIDIEDYEKYNLSQDYYVKNFVDVNQLTIDIDTLRNQFEYYNKAPLFISKEKIEFFYENVFIFDTEFEIMLQNMSITKFNSRDKYRYIDVYFCKIFALRTIVVILKDEFFNWKNITKFINNIKELKYENNFFLDTYFEELTYLSEDFEDLIKEYKYDYEKLKIDIKNDLFRKAIENICTDLSNKIVFEEIQFFDNSIYELIEIKQSDIQHYLINEFDDFLFQLEIDIFDIEKLKFIYTDKINHLPNYILNDKSYLEQFTIGLYKSIIFIVMLRKLKKKNHNKKARIKKKLIKIFEDANMQHGLMILSLFYYGIEHNTQEKLYIAVIISESLALTEDESFKLLNSLGFYKNESLNYKNGKFSKHFKFLQYSYNFNFQYLT